MAGELTRAVYDSPTHDGQIGHDVGNLALGAGEIVPIRHDQVGELANLNTPLLTLLVREPSDVLGPQAQGRLAI